VRPAVGAHHVHADGVRRGGRAPDEACRAVAALHEAQLQPHAAPPARLALRREQELRVAPPRLEARAAARARAAPPVLEDLLRGGRVRPLRRRTDERVEVREEVAWLGLG